MFIWQKLFVHIYLLEDSCLYIGDGTLAMVRWRWYAGDRTLEMVRWRWYAGDRTLAMIQLYEGDSARSRVTTCHRQRSIVASNYRRRTILIADKEM